jgi:hypothetical protein
MEQILTILFLSTVFVVLTCFSVLCIVYMIFKIYELFVEFHYVREMRKRNLGSE